ncbi:MAG: hypothetical protein F6K19_31945, partial [Cyanothece sp. SIO1E1]|nr:hypothetical protein [Cyanothece sp. SIO1E1]
MSAVLKPVIVEQHSFSKRSSRRHQQVARLPSTKRRQPPSQPSRLTVVPAVGSQPKIRDLSAFRKGAIADGSQIPIEERDL